MQPGGPNREHALNTYTLTIEGLIKPSCHDTLQGAIDALAAVLRKLPIRQDRSEAYLWLISADGGTDRVLDFLNQDGVFKLSFTASGRRYTAVIR